MTYCSPINGGCWFCQTDDEGKWYFSVEFDAYFHLDCLKQEIKLCKENDWEDQEVNIIASEFKELLENEVN